MRQTSAAAVLLMVFLTPLAVAQSQADATAPADSQAALVDQSTSAAQAGFTDASVVPPDQRATRAQLTRLFVVLRLRQQMTQYTSMMSSTMQQSMRLGIRQAMSQVPDAQRLTPEQQTKLEDIFAGYMKKVVTVYSADEAVEDATAVYQRHMSRSDVEAYITFYSSPPGQRFLDAQPVIMKEFMPIVLNKVKERSKALQTGLMQDIANFVKTQRPQSAEPAAK